MINPNNNEKKIKKIGISKRVRNLPRQSGIKTLSRVRTNFNFHLRNDFQETHSTN